MATIVLTGELRENITDTTTKQLYTFYQAVTSTEKGCAEIEVANGDTDIEVVFPKIVNQSFLGIATDKTITIKVHPYLPVTVPPTPPTPPADLSPVEVQAVMFVVGRFHKIFISNASGSVANVKITTMGERTTA